MFSTAVLAYPAAQASEGIYWSDGALKLALAANLFFQICASMSGNLISTWFGPISITGPIFFAAQLLSNLLIFWIVLGLESFTKEMQIGTYVIAVAVALLVRVGPGVQEDQDFEELMLKPWAAIWALLLIIAMFLSAIPLIPGRLEVKGIKQQWKRSAVLLIARATAFALNLTTGRALILKASEPWLVSSLILKVISGIIYTRAIVVQSTAVKQAVFVPLNTVTSLFVNAITGLIIWEDWKVVVDWTGYACIYLLFCLGICLLLSHVTLLEDADPTTFRARWALARPMERRATMERIRNYGSSHDFSEVSALAERSGSFRVRAPGSVERSTLERRLSRHNAWKSVYHLSDNFSSELEGISMISVVSQPDPIPEESENTDKSSSGEEAKRKATDGTEGCVTEP